MIGLLALVRTLSSIKTSSNFCVDACSMIASGVVRTIPRIAAARFDVRILDLSCEISDGTWKDLVFCDPLRQNVFPPRPPCEE